MEISRIEEEIIRQKQVLCELYTQRNHKLSFTFRLPTETLENIFVHCAHDYYDSEKRSTKRPGWLSLSYVCRHWRGVALNYPALWTYITIMPQCWIEEFLTRSKKAPLKIRIQVYSGNIQNSLEKVMDHVDRIQELNLVLHNHWDVGNFSLELPSRAPHLQNINISTDPYSQTSFLVLFNGDTPTLRTLELYGCQVTLGSIRLNGLTTLSLRNLPAEFQQNMEEFLALLSHMRGLTCLYLVYALRDSQAFISNAVFNTFQKITLPHLSRLWIIDPLPTVTIALLSCIDIPLSTEVRLECNSQDSFSIDNDILLCSTLAQRFSMSKDQASSSPTIRSLDIEFTQQGPKLTFRTLEQDCDSCVSKLGAMKWDCNIPLQILLIQSSVNDDHAMNDICCAIPLMHVRRAHFIKPLISSTFWKRALGHLPNLRYLKLSNCKMPDLASVLSLAPHTVDGQDKGPNQIFVPGLEELELYGIEFPSELEYGMEPSTNLESLEDALSTRRDPRVHLTQIKCFQAADNSDPCSETEDDGYGILF